MSRGETAVTAYMAASRRRVFDRIVNHPAAILHPEEMPYYDRLKAEKRRFSYLTGRYTAKLAVAEFVCDPNLSSIHIASGTFDQPVVRYPCAATPAVTLSHCDDFVTAIAHDAGHIMGIDIECIDFSKTHVFKSQITDAETRRAQHDFDDYRLGYHLIWTAKEALSKALKCGLTVPFRILEIESFTRINTSCYLCNYTNFSQYKCYSWLLEHHVLSIALPKKTELMADVPEHLPPEHAA